MLWSSFERRVYEGGKIMYWLIYTYKNRLTGYQAMKFDTVEEMNEWGEERREELNFIDITESVEGD
jgi:hypothetical protein